MSDMKETAGGVPAGDTVFIRNIDADNTGLNSTGSSPAVDATIVQPARQTGSHTAVSAAAGTSAGARSSTTGRQTAVRTGSGTTGRQAAVRAKSGATGRQTAVGAKNGATGRQKAVEATGRSKAMPAQEHRTVRQAAVAVPEKKKKISKNYIYMAVIAVALVVVMIVATVAGREKEKDRYDDYYNAAKMSYYSGDYEAALSGFRKALEISMTDDCLEMIANCYVSQGYYDKAIEILRQMDTTSPIVQQRILEIDNMKHAESQSQMVMVAGKRYDPTTTSLVIKDQGIFNDSLTEVVQLYALNSLCLSGNSLSDLSVLTSLGGLTMLDVSSNYISDASCLASLQGLRTLYLDKNPITDFTTLYGLTSLTTLSIKGIEIRTDQLSELSAALPNCAIHTETATEALLDISLGGTTFKSDVTTLDLSGRSITDISALSNCKRLTALNISGNNISDLTPLMDIPTLQTVNAANNSISDLRPLMGMNRLTSVNAAGNQISTTVPLGKVTSLTELDLSGNPIADFSGLRKLYNLTTLNLASTGVKNEDFGYFMPLSKLRSLNIENNEGLSGEAVDGLKASIVGCNVRHSDLIYSIEIAGEQFRQDITELDLSGRNLTDISMLRSFTKLETLILRYNQITDISALQGMTNLKYVDLSGNQISDAFVFVYLPGIEVLNLENNRINSVTPFMNLSNLRELYLNGNLLNSMQITGLRQAIPACAVMCDTVTDEQPVTDVPTGGIESNGYQDLNGTVTYG
ncbi:MAG: leucine-rich repeat domain-containing protein [Oscillospiraceae bacterium]|nr:leucine-rich repeat domain-containing protein [Oscillospiraceae bacterium]